MTWHDLLIFLVVFWGIGGVLSFKKRRSPCKETLFDHQNWSLWLGVLFLTGLLLALFLVSALGLVLNQSTVRFIFILLEVLIFGCLFFSPLLGVSQPYRILGLSLDHLGSRIVFAFRWIIGYFLIGEALFWLSLSLKILTDKQDSPPPPEMFLNFEIFKNEWGMWSLWLPLCFIVIFRPIFEEILFRGLLYGPMRNKVGPAIAGILTSFLFALIHGENKISLFVSGMIFVYLYERTQSLIPSIVFHMVMNLIAVIAYFRRDHFLPIEALRIQVGMGVIALSLSFIATEVIYYKMKKRGYFEKFFNEYAFK